MNSNSFQKALFAMLAGGLMLGSALTAKAAAPSPESAPALCNLGNTLVREGKFGPAILTFERAQQLAPRDPAIAANLQSVRDTAGLVAPPLVWWQSAAHVLTMNEWAWGGSLALAFVCATISFGRFFPARLGHLINALGAICAVSVLMAAGTLWVRWPELSRAVVVNAHVTALIAPAESAGPVFPLAEGEIVTTKKALRNFVLVRTADGRFGWVVRTQIEPVIPASVPDRASGPAVPGWAG